MAQKIPRKEANKPPPVCKAILLCDEVIRDPDTHKTSVIGIFDTLLVPSFPFVLQPCTVFLSLVDVIGEFALTAEVLDLKDGLVLARSPRPSQIGVPGMRTKGEQWLPVNVVLTHRGTYDLVVFADEIEIDRVQFQALTHGDRDHAKRLKEQP